MKIDDPTFWNRICLRCEKRVSINNGPCRNRLRFSGNFEVIAIAIQHTGKIDRRDAGCSEKPRVVCASRNLATKSPNR